MKEITFNDLPTVIGDIIIRLERIEALLREDHPKIQENDFLTVQEAGVYLDLARPTIYALTSKGVIPYFKRGKKVYFKKIDLEAYLLQGRRKTYKELANEERH